LNEAFGLFPDFLNKSDFEKEILSFQRYGRKGIYANLAPTTTTPYERFLAICADDVLFRGFQEISCRITKRPQVQQTIEQMEMDLALILRRRATMTRVEANSHGFQDAVSKTIQFYSDKVWAQDNTDFQLIIKLHDVLETVLTPWFAVKPFISLGSVSWKWALAEPGEPLQRPQCIVPLDSLPVVIQVGRIFGVDQKVESIRSRILKGESLAGDELQLARHFREYLETGLESKMPPLAIGTRKQREVVLTEFWKKTTLRCAPGCDCTLDKVVRMKDGLIGLRKSNNPNMVLERQSIAAWFRRMDVSMSYPGTPTRKIANSDEVSRSVQPTQHQRLASRTLKSTEYETRSHSSKSQNRITAPLARPPAQPSAQLPPAHVRQFQERAKTPPPTTASAPTREISSSVLNSSPPLSNQGPQTDTRQRTRLAQVATEPPPKKKTFRDSLKDLLCC
jgi:hypothetical protein